MRAQYEYNAKRNRAEIHVCDGPEPLTLTVAEAGKLARSLVYAIDAAFYDFTATTPNIGSPAKNENEKT